jgi:predicted RNA-binding Zn-ribbon protein involved in translation (DUF1610 family)
MFMVSPVLYCVQHTITQLLTVFTACVGAGKPHRTKARASAHAVRKALRTSPTPARVDVPPAAAAEKTSAMPSMCFACGQMLQGTEVKCPSCGAPIRGRRPEGRSGKLTVAAVLFVGLALLTTAQVAFSLLEPEASASGESALGQWTFPVSGSVHYENGTAAAGALIRVDVDNASEARADANGSYLLPKVAIGYHTLRFEAPNHTVTEYKVFISRAEAVDAVLAPGSGTVRHEDDSYRLGRTTFLVAAGLFAGLTLLLTAAAVACLRRRGYGWALAGAWFSLLDVIPSAGITVIISLILIVLVMRSKKEFR